MKRLFLLAAVLVILPRAGLAQQFQQVGTGLPGPVVWSEGVEVFDANGDGLQDIIFANGDGYDTAGTPLAPTLLINHTVPGGPITFVDETALRLPAGFVQQAKSLTVCDVDGDGDMDIVFANAFGSQPGILINDGTGHFTNQTATRFPVMSLNSFGVGFGDVDNDGDIDLVFSDEGPNTFGGPGGKARLLINDGTGHFTDGSAQLSAVNKVGAQNAQMVDIDNDFDLDIVVDGKSSGQQLYLNDGTGHFTFNGSVLPAGTGGVYATAWADLDNDHGLTDDDIDGAYISLSSDSEGAVKNMLAETGTLSFTGTTADFTGHNGDDDNDIIFVDANNDGYLDIVIGSLANNEEKLYLNNHSFSFAYQANGFSSVSDSTLDLAVGDFDNDGRYDVVTAQGESGGFTNRVYRNTGPIDTIPPNIGRVEKAPLRVPLSKLQGAGYPRRAWIQDATYKRGQTFVKARLDVTVQKGSWTQSFSSPMRYVGGGIHRATIQRPPSPQGITVGEDVTYTVHATDPPGNASDSAPLSFRICGAQVYGTPLPNSTGLVAHATPVHDPSIATNNFQVTVTGLPPQVSTVLFFGSLQDVRPLPWGNGRRYIGGPLQSLPAVLSTAGGTASINLDFTQPPLSSLEPGEAAFFQVQYDDPTAGGTNASDAIAVTFCD